MAWKLTFYSPKVSKAVEEWPVGIRACFLRIAELMEKHGPDLGMPHTKAMGAGLFEVRAKGREGIGRAFSQSERRAHRDSARHHQENGKDTGA